MKSGKSKLTNPVLILNYLLIGVLLMSTSTNASLQAAPQEQDPIVQYGPDPALFKIDGIKQSIQMWEWQSDLSRRQQELIAKTGLKWEQTLQVTSDQMDAVQQQLASVGLMLPLNSQSIQKLDDEIRNLQSEVIGLEAELKQQKSQSDATEAELKFARESRANQIELFAMRLNLLQQEYQQTKKLIEKNLVSESQLDQMKLKIAEAETELKDNQRQLELIETQLGDNVAAHVAAVAERQVQVKQRIDDLLQKRELIRDLRPLEKIERLRAQSDMARQMIEMAQVKQFELELENTRNLALIELARERIKNFPQDKPEDEVDQD